MKRLYFLFAIAAMLLASCTTKKEDDPVKENASVALDLLVGGSTRSIINGKVDLFFQQNGVSASVNIDDAVVKADRNKYPTVDENMILHFGADRAAEIWKDMYVVSCSIEGEPDFDSFSFTSEITPKSGVSLTADDKYDIHLVFVWNTNKRTSSDDFSLPGLTGDHLQSWCERRSATRQRDI